MDSNGFLVALSTPDGDITYITQAGKDVFQYQSPSVIVGQNISVVLKDHQKLEAFRYGHAGEASPAPYEKAIEVETFHDDVITAIFSPSASSSDDNSPSSAARDASSPDNFACRAMSPAHSPSSLAQAIQIQSAQFHEINKSESNADEEEEELSFDECFNDAAVECR